MLELKSITKLFAQRVVLQNFSLKLEPKEIVFVLGKSGVGKSVLLKTIVGLIRQDSGEVWVDGDRTAIDDEESLIRTRQKCGLVFQMPALLDSMTLFENLTFGLKSAPNGELEKYLECVQLPESLLTRHPSEVSFGIQKKISVVRTLLRKPKYILFDEPTTGLDPVARELTNQMIKRVSVESGTGCLIVSHDVKSALELADEIILLDSGKIGFQGKSHEFLISEDTLVKAFRRGTVM